MCFVGSQDCDRGLGSACHCYRGFARTRTIDKVLADVLVAKQTPIWEPS
jgi:hypothetical protein